MQPSQLLLLISASLFALAALAKGYLFFVVVQDGLRERRVSVDDGRLALRGSFNRYTRTYLALLTDEERRQPGNRWVARLQWLLPALALLLLASAIFHTWQTG